MLLPCLNAFNGSHYLHPKSKFFINVAHRPSMTWPDLSPINLNHALDTVIILNVPSTWHAFFHLGAFAYALPAAWKTLPMFVHLSTSYPFFQIHSSNIFSKTSLNNRLLNTPTLCFLSNLVRTLLCHTEISIYLAGFFASIKNTDHLNSL